MNIDFNHIIQLVHGTKPLIMDIKNAQTITIKGPADFVTAVDTAVQRHLQTKLCKLYPNIQFVGEEDHMNTIAPTGPAWILDPIDGTTNLICDFHHSAVSLAYYDGNEILFGVIYNPFTEETFSAIKGEGAFLNEQPILVSSKKTLAESLVAIGTSPYDKHMATENFALFQKLFEETLDIRRVGAASLDLAYVACGRLDAYVERNLKPWDFAAGAIILTEAGGKISDYSGNSLDYCKNQDILGSNGKVHDTVTQYIAQIFFKNQ